MADEIEVAICLGSNFGDRERNVRDAIVWLRGIIESSVTSEVYETPEIHGNGPSYFNAVVSGLTSLEISALDVLLKRYEIRAGRDSEARLRGEVPIDIDIVLYNGEVIRPKDYMQNFFKIGYRQILPYQNLEARR